MVNLLLLLIVFCFFAAVFLWLLKLGCNWLSGVVPPFAQFVPFIMGLAYIIVAVTVLLKFLAPLLRMLASQAGLN